MTFRFLLLNFLLLLLPSPARSAQNFRALDPQWADDQKIQIDVKDTWDATIAANRDRIQKDVAAQFPAPDRDAHIRMRVTRLLELAIDKFPTAKDKHIGAESEIADHLSRLGYQDEAAQWYLKLLQQYPGRADVAGGALYGLANLEHTSGRGYVEYAADHLQTLNRVGALADNDNAVLAGYRQLEILRRRQGRYMQAATALDAVAPLLGQDTQWRLEKAGLCADAGRADLALPYLRDIVLDRGLRDSRPEQDRIAELSESLSSSPGRLGGDENISRRLTGLRGRPFDQAAPLLENLLQSDPLGANVGPWDNALYRSVWSGVDHYLLSQDAPALQPLRTAQAAEANKAADALRRATTPSALRSFYRRFPWSSAAHAALLQAGEQSLRAGEVGLALRDFQDVLSHAEDPATHDSAQAGLWAALAQDA